MDCAKDTSRIKFSALRDYSINSLALSTSLMDEINYMEIYSKDRSFRIHSIVTFLIKSSVVCIALAGCATPNYISPEVSDNAVDRAAGDINSQPMARARYISDSQAERLVYSIYNKLLPAATEVCRKMGEDECGWNIVYSSKQEFNAFASDESTVTIHKGILKYARNEDEIALVIAHEMAHHAANHIEDTIQNANTGALLGTIIFGSLSAYANRDNYYSNYHVNRDAQTGAAVGKAIGQLSYSKDQEQEADYLAAYIMYKSGYSPENARNIFAIFSKIGKGPHGGGKMFSTHPSPAQRLASWDATVMELNDNKGLLLTKESVGDREKYKDPIAPETSVALVESSDMVDGDNIFDEWVIVDEQGHQRPMSRFVRVTTINPGKWKYVAEEMSMRAGCVGIDTPRPPVEFIKKEGGKEEYIASCADQAKIIVTCQYQVCE